MSIVLLDEATDSFDAESETRTRRKCAPLCDFIFPTHPDFVFLASADKMDGYDAFAFGCPVMGSEELEETELAQITFAA